MFVESQMIAIITRFYAYFRITTKTRTLKRTVKAQWMHIKPRCNHCLRERFMNVNMQPLLELFVIYVLLWKKFNFAYEASRSFFISAPSKKKRSSKTLSRPDIGNSTRNRTMSGIQFFCFVWNFSNYEKSFIRASSIFLWNLVSQNIARCTRRKRDKLSVSEFVSVTSCSVYRSYVQSM